MFIPLALILIVAALVLTVRSGRRSAVWMVWWPAVMLPTYCSRELGPIGFDLPTIVGISLMACFLLFGSRRGYRMVLSDMLMSAMVLTVILSEANIGGGLGSVAAILLRFALPYALGRIALAPQRETEDTTTRNVAISLMGMACIVTAGAAWVEALTYENPYWAFSGRQLEYLTRFGLRRANGPAEHPIGLGLLFVCLLPWILEGRRLSLAGAGPRWWRMTPLAVLAGIAATGSRGPVIALVIMLGVMLYINKPAWRSSFLTLALTGVTLAGVFSAQVVELLNSLEGGDPRAKITINIDGESYRYTGTNHRFLQILVYRKLIANAGLLGYGSKGMDLFTRAATGQAYVKDYPRNLPGSFDSIDCHYLYFLLDAAG